jgi:hypothetical protein
LLSAVWEAELSKKGAKLGSRPCAVQIEEGVPVKDSLLPEGDVGEEDLSEDDSMDEPVRGALM